MRRALFVGRFQPFHSGHLSVIRALADEGYDEIIIAIGSAQYHHAPTNPFSFAERKAMIEQVLATEQNLPSITIIAIPDIHDDDQWVNHINTIVQQAVGEYEAIYTGNDWVKQLFIKSQINNPTLSIKPVNQVIMIDATTIREDIRQGGDTWKQYIHPSIQEEVNQRIRELESYSN
jgi:nicotinamide-nucleotide adenylyltransferase